MTTLNNSFLVLSDDHSNIPTVNLSSKEQKVYRTFKPIVDKDIKDPSKLESNDKTYRQFTSNKKEDSAKDSNIEKITTHSTSDNISWTNIDRSKNKSYSSNSYNKYKSNNTNEIIEDTDKKRIIITNIPKKTNVESLPEYYNKRELNSKYEIPQCKDQSDWIKKVGGLEKSTTKEGLTYGIIFNSIAFYENRDYMTKNQFYSNKLSTDIIEQEEIIEKLCINTTSIITHRFIKSDNHEYIKYILENLPIYSVVHNRLDKTQYEKSIAANAYNRIKNRWIKYMHIIYHKDKYSIHEFNEADEYKKKIEKKWREYVVQSIWNCNNIIHNIVWNASKECFKYISEFCYLNDMHEELAYMLNVPNNNNPPESISLIISKGEALTTSKSNIFKKQNYEECRRFINTLLEAHKELKKEKKNTNSGDNDNVFDLIMNQDITGMIKHIKSCHDEGNIEIINKTLELWNSTAETDESLQDCLEDVKFHIKDLLPL